MINYDELPVFPLSTVLYPDMPLPLHIFEPRYLEMIEYCRAENARFGVVLLKSAHEVDGYAEACTIGTTARISQTEILSDGCVNIVATGESRFRIIETYQSKSYLTACVEPIQESTGDPLALLESFSNASDLFRTYLRSLLSLANRHIGSVQIPSAPVELSYAIANALQVTLGEKQRLLECNSTEQRLSREIQILTREIEAQAHLTDLQNQLPNEKSWEISAINSDSLRRLVSRN